MTHSDAPAIICGNVTVSSRRARRRGQPAGAFPPAPGPSARDPHRRADGGRSPRQIAAAARHPQGGERHSCRWTASSRHRGWRRSSARTGAALILHRQHHSPRHLPQKPARPSSISTGSTSPVKRRGPPAGIAIPSRTTRLSDLHLRLDRPAQGGRRRPIGALSRHCQATGELTR